MDRPVTYRDSYVVNRNLPYEIVELLPAGEYLGGGVLRKGQRVWMRYEPQATTCHRAVSVYAEDIGVISLNPHCLSRVDWQESTTFRGNASQGLNYIDVAPKLEHRTVQLSVG